MTGSVITMTEIGLVGGFKPSIMVGIGDPDNVVLAPSGTFFRDYVNNTQYINNSAGAGAGSEWTALT